tara:strand:+ start:457 stop:900 length:444 start_codon:yes stop_codon:yes gene_type:complete
MPVQDFIGTYVAQMTVGYAGMIAEGQIVKDVASKVVTTAVVPFGLAVGLGAVDNSVRLGGGGYIGVTVADKTRAADQYAVGEVAGVMRKGTIWVIADGAVTDASVVTYTEATGVIGARSVATGIVAIPGAKFETTAADGALVRVYLG